MLNSSGNQLSRRERQIMDILYEKGEQSAQDIQRALPDPPSYSGVRALIARLVDKGVVQFRTEGAKYIYAPAVAQAKVQESAVRRLVKTFFRGSRVKAVSALLDLEGETMSDLEIAELERTIARVKEAQKRAKD
jgi:BlaI family penicillinase repressor